MKKNIYFQFCSFATLLLLISCGSDRECSSCKEVKITVFTSKVETYPNFSKDLTELIIPFQNEETKDKFFPVISIQRIDLEIKKYETKINISTGGITSKMENLQKKFKKEYEKVELPKEFSEANNMKGFTKNDYFKKLGISEDTTFIFLFGKNKSWEFLKDSANVIISEVKTIEDFRLKLSENFTKNAKANFIILYNVNFLIQQIIDPVTEAINKTNDIVARIEKTKQILDSAEQAKKKIEVAIATAEKAKKGANSQDTKTLDEQIKALKNLLKQKDNEIKTLKEDIKKLQEDLNVIKGELSAEKEEHKKTKSRLGEKEQEVGILTEQNTSLTEAKNEAELAKVKTEIEKYLMAGREKTKLVELDPNNDENVVIYDLGANQEKNKVRGLKKIIKRATGEINYNEIRVNYKNALRNYKNAYNLSKQYQDIMLSEILDEAENRRKVYYALVKKAKVKGEIVYDRIEDFLKEL